jgi:UDPglucose--hexose-1-phosphate uridylyltransferase
MSEIRQDVTTNEWVIMATDRARRPHDFAHEEKESPPEYSDKCPFCPGSEGKTPPEVLAYRKDGHANGPGWWVRVIPNKFPALNPSGTIERHIESGFFRKMDGVGRHEVLIETPLHNLYIPYMEDHQVGEIILALRERYMELRKDSTVRVIIIFKNHGQSAGTSLEHPHHQIVATPIVPQSLRRRLAVATRYYDDHGGCLYCDMIDMELSAGTRVIESTNDFLVIHPYASRSPFETWILPTRHAASFGLINTEEAKALGSVLRRTLGGIFKIIGATDFNLVIHTAPIKDEDEDYFHWYMRIIPRVTTTAGFEIGSGIFINIAMPEETAASAREVQGQLKSV